MVRFADGCYLTQSPQQSMTCSQQEGESGSGAQVPAKELYLTMTFLLRVRRKERPWCLEVGRHQDVVILACQNLGTYSELDPKGQVFIKVPSPQGQMCPQAR